MADTGNTDLDHRGTFAQPRYINDMQPTTRFHPSELPADPEAIRRFPKHLIDVNHYTESPGSDSSMENRLDRAKETFLEHAHRFGGEEKMKNFIRELMGEAPLDEPGGLQAVPEVVPVEPAVEESAAAGAEGQTDAGPTGVPGAEQAATDVPPAEDEAPADGTASQ